MDFAKLKQRMMDRDRQEKTLKFLLKFLVLAIPLYAIMFFGISVPAIQESVAMAVIENGMLEIPTATVPLEEITVLMERINREISRIPLDINLIWPANLRRIPLTNPIAYQLPSIPLSGLSFAKTFKIKLPGFQLPSFSFDFGITYPSCEGESPSGGSPYPMGQINTNLGEIINIKDSINGVSNEIKDILY